MPRKIRVQYAGALYHVMSRGDRREDSLLDDVDRQDFVKAPVEACPKPDWQVLCDDVHPNPVRGRSLKAEDRFLACAWSRRGWYVAAPEHRLRWLGGAPLAGSKKDDHRGTLAQRDDADHSPDCRAAALGHLAKRPGASGPVDGLARCIAVGGG